MESLPKLDFNLLLDCQLRSSLWSQVLSCLLCNVMDPLYVSHVFHWQYYPLRSILILQAGLCSYQAGGNFVCFVSSLWSLPIMSEHLVSISNATCVIQHPEAVFLAL